MVELIFRHKMNDFQVYHDENMIQQSAGIDIFRLECLSICFFFKLNTSHSLTDCKEIIMIFKILFLNI
jgi:hypothetical protein